MDLAGMYEGEFQSGRYHGAGKFENEHGIYLGDFENGHFHGNGTYYIKKEKGGGRWEGYWEAGHLIEGEFIFDDDLVYDKNNWAYCSSRDPRFVKEIKDGVNIKGPLRDPSAKIENLENLPAGCYDCVDGYLDPKSFIVKDYATGNELRRPTQEEREWTIANARISENAENAENAETAAEVAVN